MAFEPSKYQKDIYHVFDTTNDNLLINAVAGAGKSTTLLELLKRTHQEAVFLAFNKSIQQEIQGKIGNDPSVDVMTLHSLGMKALLRHFRRSLKVKSSKCWDFAKERNSKKWKLEAKELFQIMPVIVQLVDIYRLTMCTNEEDLAQSADILGINYTKKEITFAIELIEVYKEYNKNPTEIDFTDMIYIVATTPHINFTINPKLVMIDECQDLNPCQHVLIDKLISRNNARFIACGDPYQSIYGFAGADTNSFNRFLHKSNVQQMPLSICYRCPTRVVDQANKVYDIMEPFEHNGPGTVRVGDVEEIQEGNMVICRNLKPLISVYFKLLGQGKKATVRGKDIGQNLIKMIKNHENDTIKAMLYGLGQQLEQKKQQLMDRGIDNPTNHPTYVSFQEKIEVIDFITKEIPTVKKTIQFLENLFADKDRNGVILSTIHKSKGLENHDIFLLDKHLIPSKYAKTPDQLKQEKNLLYVAITRSQENLIYIKSNK